MKHLLYCLCLASLAFSCTENEPADERPDNILVPDSTEIFINPTDTVVEEVVIEYTMFEDYATLTTRAALLEAFDEMHMTHDTAWYAEGTVMMPRTTLTNPKNGHIIQFVWNEQDPDMLSQIVAMSEIYDENYEIVAKQKVTSETGLFSGMSLAELKDWNGDDFAFSGFGWDYGGGIFMEDSSRLFNCGLNLTLTMEYSEDPTLDDYYGDIELKTSAPGILEAPIFLNNLILYLDNPPVD